MTTGLWHMDDGVGGVCGVGHHHRCHHHYHYHHHNHHHHHCRCHHCRRHHFCCHPTHLVKDTVSDDFSTSEWKQWTSLELKELSGWNGRDRVCVIWFSANSKIFNSIVPIPSTHQRKTSKPPLFHHHDASFCAKFNGRLSHSENPKSGIVSLRKFGEWYSITPKFWGVV